MHKKKDIFIQKTMSECLLRGFQIDASMIDVEGKDRVEAVRCALKDIVDA